MGEKTPEAMAHQRSEGLRKATEVILPLFSYISPSCSSTSIDFKAILFAIAVFNYAASK